MPVTKLTPQESQIFYQKYWEQTTTPERVTHNEKCRNNRSFYYSDQWDSTKQKDKSDLGQYMITINRSKKYIEGQIGLLTGSVPTIKVHPFGSEDSIMSDISNAILSSIFNNSSGKVMLSRILKFGAIDNINYAHVKKGKDGKIIFDSLYFDEVMPNTETKDPFFRDAETFYIERYVSKKKVAAIFNILETELSGDIPPNLYTLVNSDGYRTTINQVYDTYKQFVKLIETYNTNYTPITTTVTDPQGVAQEVPTGNYKVSIEKKIIIGYNHCYKEDVNQKINVHCIVPFYCEDTPNIYKLGSLEFIKEQQRLLNASFGIMLLNAQMSSTSRLLLWEDQIPDNDLEKFKANYNKTGSITVLKGDGKDTPLPVVIQPLPLVNAFYQLTTMMMQEMEFNMLPNQLLGMDSTQQNQASNVFKNYELMLNSMRTMFTIYDGFFAVLGKVLLQYYFAYTPPEDIKRLVGANDMLQQLQSAADSGLNIEDDQAVQNWTNQRVEAGDNPYELKRFIGTLTYNLKYLNTLNEMLKDNTWTDYDIVIEKGSYLPSYSMMKFFMKYELFKAGIVDNETVLEDMPFGNKEQIRQRISQLNIMQQKLQELETVNQQLVSENEMYKQALTESKAEVITEVQNLRMDKQYNDTRQKDMAARKIQNSKYNTVLSEDRMKLKQQVDEQVLQLKYEVAKLKLQQANAGTATGEPLSLKQYLEGVTTE